MCVSASSPARASLPKSSKSSASSWSATGVPRPAAARPTTAASRVATGNSTDRAGFVFTATYENGFTTRDEERTFFRVGADGGVTPDNIYDFDYSEEKVRQALTGNFSYKLAENHHIQLKGLFTTLSNGEGRFQEGFFSDLGNDIENFRVSFLEQDITSFQLSGDNYFNNFGSGGSLLEWKASFSEAETAENRREALYEEQFDGVFRYSDAAQSGFMYYNDLTDEVGDFKLDFTRFFNGDNSFGSIKAGLAYTTNEREFAGRRLRFFLRSAFGIDLSLPPEELFTEENIRPFGFEVEEVTRATDTYLGDHQIPAAYVQADFAWGDWRLIGGVRFEDSDQEVITFDRNDPENPADRHRAGGRRRPAVDLPGAQARPRHQPALLRQPDRQPAGVPRAGAVRLHSYRRRASPPSATPSWCAPRSPASTLAGSGSRRLAK